MEVFTAKETTKLAHLRVSAYLSFTCYAHGYETSYEMNTGTTGDKRKRKFSLLWNQPR